MTRIPIFKAAIRQHNAIHRALHKSRSIPLPIPRQASPLPPPRKSKCPKRDALPFRLLQAPLTNDALPSRLLQAPLKNGGIHETWQQIRQMSSKGTQGVSTASAWNAANAVTAGRVLAAPFTAYAITTGAYDCALGALLYAGASDWLDGYLARRYRLRTVVGSYLDPAADKLLITSATIALAYQGVMPTWLVSLIIGRDVAIVTGSMILMRRKRHKKMESLPHVDVGHAIEPHFISKVNTTCQIAYMFAAVLHAGDWAIVSASVLHGIGLATAITTSSSGLMYGHTFWKLLKRRQNR